MMFLRARLPPPALDALSKAKFEFESFSYAVKEYAELLEKLGKVAML